MSKVRKFRQQTTYRDFHTLIRQEPHLRHTQTRIHRENDSHCYCKRLVLLLLHISQRQRTPLR